MFAGGLADGRLGYMPLKRGYGFVDVPGHGGDEELLLRTLAHELGHGAFGLEHLDSRYGHLGYTGGGTDNLMDRGTGTHLGVWQWHNCHDPEVKLPGSRDDEAGESLDYYDETDADQFAAALSQLACAAHRGEAETIVVLPSTVTAKDAVDVPEKWTQAGIALEASSLLAGPRRLSTAAPERTASEDGERVQLRFTGIGGADFVVECSAEDAEAVADWYEGGAENLFAAEAEAIAAGAEEGDDELFGALVRLSPCAMERVGAAERMAYVARAVDDWYMNADQERIVGRLFAEVGDEGAGATALARERKAFGEALASYRDYELLFSKVDDDPGAFRDVLAGLLRAFWAVSPGARPPEVVGGGADGRGDLEVEMTLVMRELAEDSGGGLRSDNITVEQLPNGALAFARTVTTSTQYGGEGNPAGRRTATMALDTAHPMEAVVAYAGRGQRDLGLSEGQYMGIVPAAYAAALAVRRTEALEAMERQVALDMTLAMTGVAELNAALRGWQQLRTAQRLMRLTLAVADLATVNADIVCAEGESELCREWQRVSVYVQLGLLGVSAADGLGGLIERTKRRGTAVAGDAAAVLARVDELLPDDAARAAFRTDWGAGDDGLRAYFFGAADGVLEQRARAWQLLPEGVRGDVAWLRQMERWLPFGATSAKRGDATVISVRTQGGSVVEFAEIRGGQMFVKYDGYGGDIAVSPDRVTTVLGKFNDPTDGQGTSVFLAKDGGHYDGVIARVVNDDPPGNSIAFLDLPESQYNALLNEGVEELILTSSGFDGDLGRLNVLEGKNPWGSDYVEVVHKEILPDLDLIDVKTIVTDGRDLGNSKFWTEYNLPFLERAFERGDDIRLASRPQGEARSGTYERELKTIEAASSGLADRYGYVYEEATRTYVKR